MLNVSSEFRRRGLMKWGYSTFGNRAVYASPLFHCAPARFSRYRNKVPCSPHPVVRSMGWISIAWWKTTMLSSRKVRRPYIGFPIGVQVCHPLFFLVVFMIILFLWLLCSSHLLSAAVAQIVFIFILFQLLYAPDSTAFAVVPIPCAPLTVLDLPAVLDHLADPHALQARQDEMIKW